MCFPSLSLCTKLWSGKLKGLCSAAAPCVVAVHHTAALPSSTTEMIPQSKWLAENDPKPKSSCRKSIWQTVTLYSTHRYPHRHTHMYTHTLGLPPGAEAVCYSEKAFQLRVRGKSGSKSVSKNTICDMLSCPCVAPKGFVGLGSKLSKPTKWVAQCREELLWFTRQDYLYGFYFCTLHHAQRKPWANTARWHLILTHKGY